MFAFAWCTKFLFCDLNLLSFLPVFQKQKLSEIFMVLRNAWKCCFTNTVPYSSLLRFPSVKYASYFQFSFARKSCWKLAVRVLFTHGQCCWRDSWAGGRRLWPCCCGFSQCLPCEHRESGGGMRVVPPQFGFRFFFFGLLQIWTSKWEGLFEKQQCSFFPVWNLRGTWRLCAVCCVVKILGGGAACRLSLCEESPKNWWVWSW